jgi:hypothetical protein
MVIAVGTKQPSSSSSPLAEARMPIESQLSRTSSPSVSRRIKVISSCWSGVRLVTRNRSAAGALVVNILWPLTRTPPSTTTSSVDGCRFDAAIPGGKRSCQLPRGRNELADDHVARSADAGTRSKCSSAAMLVPAHPAPGVEGFSNRDQYRVVGGSGLVDHFAEEGFTCGLIV